MRDRVDVVVVGAGHNGLVAAGYLAKAGMKTLVLERGEQAGGMAKTSELAPGFQVPTIAHTVGRLRPSGLQSSRYADLDPERDVARRGMERTPFAQPRRDNLLGFWSVTRDFVLALKGHLPTGEFVEWGTPTKKFSAGFNLRDLWIGSEGATITRNAGRSASRCPQCWTH
jgi:glycine/D-amino acid oxidase-like deaminating enzyme